MKKLYYTYLIIRESKQPIPAKNIKMILEQKYHIKTDIKTIYTNIAHLNELFDLFCHKKLIRTIRRTGYCIEEEFFDDGQLQYLFDSIIFNQDMTMEETESFVKSLSALSSTRQMERIHLSVNHHHQKYPYLLNLTTIIKAIHDKSNIYFKYVSYEIQNHQLVEVYRHHGNDSQNREYYIVSPYKIIQRDSKYYLLGYFDGRKEQLSIYRLDRMRLVRNHKSVFVDIREQYDFERELDNNVNMYVSGYRSTLEICFDEAIMREVVDHFGFHCHVEETIDHHYTMIVDDVLISQGLIGWLMMLQDHVKVIRPLQLKEEMLTIIKRMKQLYM